MYSSLDEIRNALGQLYVKQDYVTDKTGVSTVEIIGSSIKIDPNEDHIFGVPNYDYIEREIKWYDSQSLKVDDIPGKTPDIWSKVSDKDGYINSNYGFLVYSFENYSQYANVLEELRKNPYSRRAIAIYTRPSMHYDYNRNGMSDFVCTNTVQYLIRDDKLDVVVNMRSNDAIFGFRNDLAWQRTVQLRMADDLENVDLGTIYWQTGSLHIYERHFYLIHHYVNTGETYISLEDFKKLYPHYNNLA